MDAIVLGAGIIGVSTAVHLARRGRSVLLVDKLAPGRETSFGNAGIIQSEGRRPYKFPREFDAFMRVALGKTLHVRYDWTALPALTEPLIRYWRNSGPDRYQQITQEYAPLIAHATAEHEHLISASRSEHLIRRNGWLKFYRNQATFDLACAEAESLQAEFDVPHRKLDAGGLRALEPGLGTDVAGAIHWTQPWTVTDPGALVEAYARLFHTCGGTFVRGDAATLEAAPGTGWRIVTDDGPMLASDVVIALGPWSSGLIQRLGYRMPLFAKRGYHMHYAAHPEGRLSHVLLDADQGYLLAPMRQGIRLTTGVEFAPLDAPPNPIQLNDAEALLREDFALGERLHDQPWMGARPCTPDMKPVIGPASKHGGLWFAFGHAHHGLTLGPLTGRLLAEQMCGESPMLDLSAFSAGRF